MTAIAMKYVVNPVEGFFGRLGSAIIYFAETAGRARAASELARQGYQEEAKALMLEVQKIREART